MNQDTHHRYSLRWFGRNLYNRPLLKTISHLALETQCQIIATWQNETAVTAILKQAEVDDSTAGQVLDAIGRMKSDRRTARRPFGGIGRRQTRNYRNVSIPFVDGTTRLLLPQSAFERFRARQNNNRKGVRPNDLCN